MSIWDTVTRAVATGRLAATDAALLIRASIAAYHDFKSGKAKDPLQALLMQSETLKPIIESVISFLVPGGATVSAIAFEAAAYLLTHAHKMTPEEEKRWMDRASGSWG